MGMKYLPVVLFVGALAIVLRAEAPQTKPAATPEPQPKPQPQTQPAAEAKTNPKGDPFVKDAGPANGQGDEDESFKVVQVVLETYVLDQEDAQAVLEGERGSAARYRRVLDLAKAGKARLELLSGLSTRSGQRAVVESGDEVRYPVEFTGPAQPKGTLVVTAFETRNVGDTLEVEPVVQPDGRTCEINLVPQRVSLVGFRQEPDAPDMLKAPQPIFDTQKITTAVTTTDGQPHFLGTMSRTSSRGPASGEVDPEVRLAFLHTSVVEVPTGKAKGRAGENVSGEAEFTYSFYSLDRETAREVLIAPASMHASWDKVQALLAAKKARLEHVSTIRTKSGQRAMMEEIREERYPTEFSPPGGLPKTDTTKRETVTEASAQVGPDHETKTTETTTVTHASPEDPQIPGVASAFQTRNVGVTIEVDPVIGPDGVTVDLSESIKWVKYLGDFKAPGLDPHLMPQPLFENAAVTTSQGTSSGQHVFVGTMNPPGADGVHERVDTGRTWLLFVRASVDEP